MSSPWIYARFDETRVVTAIQTQGSGENGSYVKQYKIEINDGAWRYMQSDDGDDVVFNGNTDGSTVVLNYLPELVETEDVILYAIDYFRAPALRWAVLGCPI